MTNSLENNKRIAKNTMLLYVRMLFTMAVGLYTSRIVLNTLGVEDFGIYNVVGGVVVMFSIISGSLSTSVSRFLTFELGRNDTNKLKKVFTTSMTIHITLALVIFILAESIGVWFLNTQMNIPPERLSAANWTLQCSILTFIFNLISIPYNAAIIAHEQMKAFAYISILEVSLKLAVVFLLYISMFDKLKVYAILLLSVAISIRFVYVLYCKRHFEECTYHFSYEKKTLREMTGFAGWNFIGASSAVLRDQGVNIVLNIFCGASVNAARGIAFQANAAVSNFVNNFMMALNPQITKSYADNNHDYMMTLLFKGARLSFYMLLFLAIPIIFETQFILSIWLGNVPPHCVNFIRLILIYTMCESLSTPLITAMLATGRIRNYQIIVGGLQMLNLPMSFILLKIGCIPESTLIAAICIAICCLIARLIMLRGMIQLPVGKFVRNVIGNAGIVTITSFILPYIIYQNSTRDFTGFVILTSISFTSTAINIYFIGCNKQERAFIIQKITTLKNKLSK